MNNLLQMKFKFIGPDDWNLLSENKNTIERISSDKVSVVYLQLLDQFNSWNNLSWNNLIFGIHAVYGWMPTMIDVEALSSENINRNYILKLFNESRERYLLTEELELLARIFSKNRAVGLSKLLHFISPDRYMIWDSRVQSAYYQMTLPNYNYWSSTYAFNNDYILPVNDWLHDTTSVNELKIRNLNKYLSKVSRLRILEIVLFNSYKF